MPRLFFTTAKNVTAPQYSRQRIPTEFVLFLSFCKATFISFGPGLLGYGVTSTNIGNATVLIANNVDANHRQSLCALVGLLKDLNQSHVIICYIGETTACSMGDGHLRKYNTHPEIGQSRGIANCSSSFPLGTPLRLEDDYNDYGQGMQIPIR
jgi:hypothetical protein